MGKKATKSSKKTVKKVKKDRKVKKEPKPKKEVKKKPKANIVERENFKGIVRIGGKDVRGHIKLRNALLRVQGFSHTTALVTSNVLASELKISPFMQVGELSDEQIEKIDDIIFNLHKYNIPEFLMNRRKDFVSGENRHVVMNDLIFAVTQDVDREKKMFSWRGFRHAYGQKVRGQRTKNTGRGGTALGVVRKANAPQKKK